MEIKFKQEILDIKYLLLNIWETQENEYCRNPWSKNGKFKEIANRYNITKDNIFDGLDKEIVNEYKEYLPWQSNEGDE